ncbi:hypothetical protein SLS62_007201 [Diatrype stigma]|uniref:Argonaute sirna chaperone complex subunit arb1 n=1 Tax=Diatrype stigma TaxID=117547 RepID=A0AAN9UPA8_9PEZI
MAEQAAIAPSNQTGDEIVASEGVVAQPKSTDAVVTSRDPDVTGHPAQQDADIASGGVGEHSPISGKIGSPGGDESRGDGHAHADNDPVNPDGGDAAPVNVGKNPGEPVKKKKKPKNKRKGGLAGHKTASGFEEFYADPPMTPTEAAEEQSTYHHRIEECIQRYRARRRFDQERTLMFNKYLFMGGIDSQPRQFTGMDSHAFGDADKDEIRTMTAVDFIGGAGSRFFELGDEDNWEIDFEGVVKGFLSRTVFETYMYDEPAMEKAAALVKNFLNYVLTHNVCPEYVGNIMAARNICDIALPEMRAVHELLSDLPGKFNSAATALFCGERAIHDLDKPENFNKFVNFRLVVLETTTNVEARKKLAELEDTASIRVVETKEETYEVLDIVRPRRNYVKMLEEQLAQQQLSGVVRPTGRVLLRPAIIAHGYDNLPRPDEIDLSAAPAEEYLVEDDILAKLERGMKLKLVVGMLDIGGSRGIRFIQEVRDIRVSFDTFLPQSLMERWKEPVPNDRPPPCAADPAAEEQTANPAAAADDNTGDA